MVRAAIVPPSAGEMSEFVHLSEKEIDDIFDSLDANGDGFISAEDLRHGLARELMHLKIFIHKSRADGNKEKSEGKEGAPGLETSNSQPCEYEGEFVNAVIARIGDKESGFVSRSEFFKYVGERERNMEATFRMADQNTDGRLTGAEIRLALQSLELRASDRQIRQFMKHADSNNDGVITYDEFRAFFLLLPASNSEALFEYWSQNHVDLGEDFRVPDDKEKATNASAIVIFTSGAVAGAFSRTMTAPADRLKVMLQARADMTIHSGIRLMMTQGWKSMYRGNGVNVLKLAPESGIKFFCFDQFKHLLATDAAAPLPMERFVAGSMAGVTAQTAIYPLEIVKTRLAVSENYKGIFDCLRKMLKYEGFRSLYKGLGTSTIGILPYAGVDLAIYSSLKDAYTTRYPKEPPSITTLLLCGACSSVCGQVVAYPLQLVRTKMQTQGLPGMEVFKGPVDCMRTIIRREGVGGLYHGISANFAKTIPAVSISYAAFERTKDLLTEQ